MARFDRKQWHSQTEIASFINSFDFEDDAKHIYMVFYKRLSDIHFRMFMLFSDKVVMNDFGLKDSDGFDKAMNIGKQFLDAFLGGIFYDDIVEIDPVFNDLTDITNVTYQIRRGNIAIELENQEKPVYLDMDAIKEKDHKHSLFSTFADLIMNLSVALNEKKQGFEKYFDIIGYLENEGEEIDVITSSIKEKYAENFNNSEIQIPLFKFIKHNNYLIFIGIPYNTSINELTHNQMRKQDDLISNLKSDSIYFYDRYKRGDFYITEYAAKFSNNSLIYISTISPSKELTDSLFIKSELKRRLNTSNK